MPDKKQDNIEVLEAAGVLDSSTLSVSQKEMIRGLTPAEVQHLISSRQKVGDYSTSAHPAGRPWIL
jgi:hypothetical protein